MRIFLIFGLFFYVPLIQAQNVLVYSSLEKAKKQAKKENKILLIDVYTDWCGWCKVLDKRTYSDSLVKEAISKNFIMVKLNAEVEGEGRSFALRYGITGYPTIYYLNAKNKVVHVNVGFKEPADYLKELDTIVKLHNRGFYYSGYSGASLKMPEFYLNYFPTKEKKKVWVPDHIRDSFLIKEGFDTERAFIVMKSIGLGPKSRSMVSPHIRSYYSRYPQVEVNEISSDLIAAWVKQHNSDSILPISKLKELIYSVGPSDKKEQQFWETHFVMQMYESRDMWREYAETYDAEISRNGLKGQVNDIAWNIYEKSTNEVALRLALTWMTELVKTSNDYYHLDTYAALLFANGFINQAREAALKAIEEGEKQNVSTEETQKLLDKINGKS